MVFLQDATPAWAAAVVPLLRYFEVVQDEQLLAPALEYLLSPHTVQPDAAVPPVLLRYVPASHLVAADAPAGQ